MDGPQTTGSERTQYTQGTPGSALNQHAQQTHLLQQPTSHAECHIGSAVPRIKRGPQDVLRGLGLRVSLVAVWDYVIAQTPVLN